MKVLRGSGTSLGTETVDSLTVGRAGLTDEEYARVMPALRLAVIKDNQVQYSSVDIDIVRVK